MSLAAEQAVLGAVLLTSGGCLWEVTDILKPECFSRPDHQQTFKAMLELADRKSPADIVTLGEHLNGNDTVDISYLAQVELETPGASNVQAYAKIVRESWVKRQIKELASDLMNSEGNPADTLSAGMQRMMDLAVDDRDNKLAKASDSIPGVIDRLDKLNNAESGLIGTSCGYHDLDKKIAGLQPGHLVIIAGRPGMGKSALAMNIAQHISYDKLLPTLIFSMEMDKEEIVSRMASAWASVNIREQFEDEDWKGIQGGLEKISKSRMWIDSSSAINIGHVFAVSQKVKHMEQGLGLVVVDYLQLMGSNQENRVQQLAEITRGLKKLAGDLKVPVIGLSQLNRDVERRDNKRPRLSDLREAGTIEQDADVVMFIYRDVVYNEKTLHPRVAEIKIEKQRGGPLGTVLLWFEGNFVRFRQMDHESQQSFWSTKLDKNKRRGIDDF